MPCAEAVLDATMIGQVHRVVALGAFLDGEVDPGQEALAGLFMAQPGFQIPVALLPDGHPIRLAIPKAIARLQGDEGVSPPKVSGAVLVDGARGEPLPTRRASVIQQLDPTGRIFGAFDTRKHVFTTPPDFDYLLVLGGDHGEKSGKEIAFLVGAVGEGDGVRRTTAPSSSTRSAPRRPRSRRYSCGPWRTARSRWSAGRSGG